MERKRLLLLLCVTLLFAFCLSGCGKNQVVGSEEYSPSEITTLQVDADTWKLNIMASSDENIRVSLDGSISDTDSKPAATLQNGFLTVVQKINGEGLQDQIALGKKGQITIYFPSDCTLPLKINNGIGDIEVDSISATDFYLANKAGYVLFSHLITPNLEVSSTSGDITIKNSEIDNMTIVTASGYVELNSPTFISTEIITKSGEVNMSEISPNTNINVQTGSGDINLNYQSVPDNLDFGIASGSKDITARFNGATYTKEITACKQGMIGAGQYKLAINSDNGTVVVK